MSYAVLEHPLISLSVIVVFGAIFWCLSPRGRINWCLALMTVSVATWAWGDVGLLLGAVSGAALMTKVAVSHLKPAQSAGNLKTSTAGRVRLSEYSASSRQPEFSLSAREQRPLPECV